MVKIGNYRDQFSNTPTPKTNPGQLSRLATAGDSQDFNAPYIETDIVGQGYPNATPIVPPPGSSSGAVVNTSPNPYQGIFSRHNTPSNSSEKGGKVQMALISGVATLISGTTIQTFRPVVQFTPPEVEP